MKKVLSILFLILFFFNLGGYYLVFWTMIRNADEAMTQRLDLGLYLPEENIEFKIPVSLPYPIGDKDFERADGTYENEGVYYKVLKRKIQADTVYIVCVRNHQQERLADVISDYVKTTNEVPSSSHDFPGFMGKLMKDYVSAPLDDIGYQKGWVLKINLPQKFFVLLPAETNVPSPPPKG